VQENNEAAKLKGYGFKSSPGKMLHKSNPAKKRQTGISKAKVHPVLRGDTRKTLKNNPNFVSDGKPPPHALPNKQKNRDRAGTNPDPNLSPESSMSESVDGDEQDVQNNIEFTFSQEPPLTPKIRRERSKERSDEKEASQQPLFGENISNVDSLESDNEEMVEQAEESHQAVEEQELAEQGVAEDRGRGERNALDVEENQSLIPRFHALQGPPSGASETIENGDKAGPG